MQPTENGLWISPLALFHENQSANAYLNPVVWACPCEKVGVDHDHMERLDYVFWRTARTA